MNKTELILQGRRWRILARERFSGMVRWDALSMEGLL